MITIDYIISDIERQDGKVLLWLTRPFGPIPEEQAGDLKEGDEMTINIAFPGDIPPDAPTDENQLNLFDGHEVVSDNGETVLREECEHGIYS
jgi:hypothetical protein